MSGWAFFWCAVIITAITSYFGFACVITVGGIFDLRKMFKRLNEAHHAYKKSAGQASEGP